jgi:hypothetical protein
MNRQNAKKERREKQKSEENRTPEAVDQKLVTGLLLCVLRVLCGEMLFQGEPGMLRGG